MNKEMKPIKWIILICFGIIGQGVANSLISGLKRVKRWEGTGDMGNMFRGTAGVDYPDYKNIPTTNFRCSDHQYEGGLYADVETQCQVYHVCHEGRKDSFLCGRGTVFNQQILACDYWYSTECDTAPSFYYLNAQIGNPGSSWVPQEGKFQFQAQNQGTNYDSQHGDRTGKYNPQQGDQGTNYDLQNRDQGTNYDPQNVDQGTNYDPQQGDQGTNYDPQNRDQGTNYDPQNVNQGTNYDPQNGDQGNNYDPQHGDQGVNYDPQSENQETNQNYPQNENGGYNIPNNPPASNGGNVNGQRNPSTSLQGSHNPGSGGEYKPDFKSNPNQQSDHVGNNQDVSSCCCLKNTYKAPWNFPAFPGK